MFFSPGVSEHHVYIVIFFLYDIIAHSMERYWDGLVKTLFTDLPDDILEYICKLAEEFDIAGRKYMLHRQLRPLALDSNPCTGTLGWLSDLGVSNTFTNFAIFHIAWSKGTCQVLASHEAPELFNLVEPFIEQLYGHTVKHFTPGIAMGAFELGSTKKLWLLLRYVDTEETYLRIYGFTDDRYEDDDVPLIYEVMTYENLEMSIRFYSGKIMPQWFRRYLNKAMMNNKDLQELDFLLE